MDLLLNRYSNVEFILKLDIKTGMALYKKAQEKTEETKSWQIWVSKFPWFDKDSFIPFSEFYRKSIEPISTRPAEDILKEVYEIREKMSCKK